MSNQLFLIRSNASQIIRSTNVWRTCVVLVTCLGDCWVSPSHWQQVWYPWIWPLLCWSVYRCIIHCPQGSHFVFPGHTLLHMWSKGRQTYDCKHSVLQTNMQKYDKIINMIVWMIYQNKMFQRKIGYTLPCVFHHCWLFFCWFPT